MQSQGYDKRIKCEVLVVGAGPAGMMAAIIAARAGSKVIVIEQKDMPGKKIYATGNGRCNFTNQHYDSRVFRGEDPKFAYEAYKRFDKDALIGFMKELGVAFRDINGYIYPYNEQARSVANALLYECKRLGIEIRCNEKTLDITQDNKIDNDSDFLVTTDKDVYICEKVIIAAGGKASPTHGSDGNLNKVIRKLGHEIILQDPALVPLRFADNSLSLLAGVRCKCKTVLMIDGYETDNESGEIIFNNDNISGIPVMQLSRYAVKALTAKSKVSLELDLIPDMNDAFLKDFLETSVKKRSGIFETLGLVVNDKIAKYICDRIKDIDELIHFLKHFRIEIIGDCGFNKAQVTAGGVNVAQITKDMESKIIRRLFFAGEILDIDGTCGGYNLQWAFTSGYLAGTAASVKQS